MQPVIKAYPNTKFVLLHSSYPFTQEAGYLTAVYQNVYLDFGEIFPFLSADGQRDVVKQVLELCPTNKIMWSSASLLDCSADHASSNVPDSRWTLLARVILPRNDTGTGCCVPGTTYALMHPRERT